MAEDGTRFDSPDSLQGELDGLRRELLPAFLAPLLAIPVIWLVHVTRGDWAVGPVDVAVLQLVPSLYVVFKLRDKHYNLACWILVLCASLAEGLLVAAYRDPMVMAFGALVVILAHALLGTLPAFVAGTVTWGGVAAAWYLPAGPHPNSTLIEVLALYYLVWGAMWLSNRPLRTSISWALNGCKQAHQLLLETRERRGELYRVVRALEEATYRIERMNSELLVAWHQAGEARAQKERFVATVSHELRGPLNLILGYSRLMMMSPERYPASLPPCYRADVATIYRNSQHLANLVDDVLDLSRIEAHRLPLVKDRVDLGAVVDEAVSAIQPLAERKGLYVHKELAADLPLILADCVRLRQVVLNLLTNSVRFTERGGITVRTARRENELMVAIRDTGPGIETKDLSKIFREFHQTHLAGGSANRAERGTGLGLSISKYLIELHGGEIWAESQKGAYAAFYFTVPILGAEDALAPETIQSQYRGHPQPGCAIAHADPGIVKLLARHLEGYRVMGVTNENEVVTLAQELHPKAIITSPESVERIQDRLGDSADVPIISCQWPRLTEQTGLESVLGYLVKPIAPDMVRAAMSKVERDGETTVLLVDDEPDTVRLIETMMTSLHHPYRILKAYDGSQALDIMRQVVPDIVFMDLIMPGLDGEQAIARMRLDQRLRAVPVVIISGRDWIEGGVTLDTPISVRCRKPLGIAKAIKCVQSLLGVLEADYLPASAHSGLSESAVAH